ncbi:hypothetical protein [Sphaerisporangium perillae]|uniref:hypothetical protein n=1 Tax=Sphaerisporangium perillae TaxID=2935860 RepID=UPI00200BE48E|nr:hypothetical protein [Sphaerisporangium perillae]
MTSSGTATADVLAEEIRTLVRSGLPVRLSQCGPHLLALHGVRGRCLRPDDPASRARALDALLREQLDRLENAELAASVRLLFGAEAATSGATLTARRAAAARAAGYEVHHFRKRIEPKLTELLAWQLRRDSDAFTARRAEPPQLPAARAPLVLPTDVFAWEAAEHQHAVARLWGAVYLLRAELLTVARLVSMAAADDVLAAASQAALWRQALVLQAAGLYRNAYGAVLLHAAGDLGPDQIAALAGWTPGLSPAQELLLAACADREQGVAHFNARLNAAEGGAELAAAWLQALTGRDSGPDRKRAHRDEP